MRPVAFSGYNVVFAEDQPQYTPLPAFRGPDGEVISAWRLTLWERLKLLVTGRLWLRQLTFRTPLQPQLPTVEYPFVKT